MPAQLTDEINEGDRKNGGPGVVEKSANKKYGLGTFSTLSIGIGGMVGGGIFAVTGLTIQVTNYGKSCQSSIGP